MDFVEFIKRLRRLFDGNFSNRKVLLILLAVLVILLYMGPILFRKISFTPVYSTKESLMGRLSSQLSEYSLDNDVYDCHIQHLPPLVDEKTFIPYVGNGFIGLQVDPESFLMIKNGRTLSLPVNFRPITTLSFEGHDMEEALVTHYKNGIVNRIQVWQPVHGDTIDITYRSYAHRTIPSLFIQDIKIVNPTNNDYIVEVDRLGLKDWGSASTRIMKIQHGNGYHDYLTISGLVEVPNSDMVVPITIITLNIPSSIEVKGKLSTTLHVVTSINYTDPIKREDYPPIKGQVELSAIKVLKEAVTGNVKKLRINHISVWQHLWLSGFSISESKAENAINGDLINATIYSIVSQSRAPIHEVQTLPQSKEGIAKDLAYAEGCYDGHHTLQAKTLWTSLNTLDDVNNVVSLWLMTLEKQGCHQLLRAGANGVIQAMLLSFGGFQFSNQHLEFNADPSHLHRDYFFRRISYGQKTHLNISVVVQDDYKAVLYLALDRSDKNYYGCDAGCLDPPVQLGPEPKMFPVKKTLPLTAILYITSDKLHMEELKHTIHVEEIAIAPPHEHHVIAIHKHGHKWGGLPSIFWMAIIALIAIFHLFLFKLVINEYCGTEIRVKYRKLSDFE